MSCTACSEEKKKQDDAMPALAQGPARKASGDIGDSFAGFGEQLAQESKPAKSASSLATDGFSGAGQELPDREFHEKSFGRSFANVRVYTDGAAAAACSKLNARAYTVGNKIAFADASLLQNKSLVAHELTHVGQHTGGPSRKATGGADDDGIDRSGEDEAERVEAAVGEGKPALSALGGESHDHDHDEAQGARKGPARKESPWGAAFELDANELKLQGSYNFKGAPISTPIPGVPGLFAFFKPSFTAKFGGGKGYGANSNNFSVSVGLEGSLEGGLSLGECNYACVYLSVDATVGGGFEFKQEGDNWHFQGGLKLESNGNFGVSLVNGYALDYKWKFASITLATVTGIRIIGTYGKFGPKVDGGPTFAFGPEIQAVFDKFAWAMKKVKALV